MQKQYLRTVIIPILCGIVFTVPFSISTAATSSSTAIGSTTASGTTTTLVPNSPPAVHDNMRAKLQPLAQTRITNLAANFSNRLDATVRRLDNVHTRLQSRLEKSKSSGLTTTTAQNALDMASAEIDTAKKSLSTIDIEVTSFVGSENPVTSWLRLESIYRTIIKNVLSAHTSLQSALTALETATPATPSTTQVSSSTITR